MTAVRPADVDRPMPQAVAAERALLGGVLLEGSSWLVVCDLLTPADFYRPEHAALWRLFASMAGEGTAIDLVTVGDRIASDAARYGGASYVAGLPEHAPATTNLRHYAETVRDRSVLRRLIAAAQAIVSAAHGVPVAELPATDNADELVQAAAARLSGLSAPVQRSTWSVAEAVELTERERREALERGEAREYTTGFPVLDHALDGGMRPGDLVVIGGSTSMGKSALAMSIAYGAANTGAAVGYASVEPRRPEWAQRSLACLSHVPMGVLRGKRRDPSDEQLIADWVRALATYRVELYYRPGARLLDVATQARRWKMTQGLDVLVVDYLQLMRHDRRGERHDLAVGETVGGLKQLAGELGIVVVVLSQITRSSTKERVRAAPGGQTAEWARWWSDAQIPRVQDLKESGSIENDADVVLFPVRADRAGPDSTAIEGAPRNAALIAVAKQRNGRTGIVPAEWDGPCACYRPIEPPRRHERAGDDDPEGQLLDRLEDSWR